MRRRWIRAGALTVAVAAVALLLWPARPALRVSDEGRALGHLPLAEGEALTVAYTHSIDGLPIEEDLVVEDGHLVVDATRLRQFGAGMGQIPGEGHGRADGRWWVVEDLDRDIGPELVLRVGSSEVDHRLRVPGTEVELSPCLAGQRVTVEPVRVSTLRLWLDGGPRPDC
ncbi:DUF1850 domain-containing protein [Nocardiopsis sp. HNM0947]|uniref:DUF1850 domain-containing protein n=1 Tax=Nocardiopsis coralli TaxID=2772213 RepID=A0ABR9P5Q8_9ACTN|nr:DUF1850 domain-containing protein [Nocardiopsis coralli]MBE2999181.1 DUF1850 domain-containing protein [Nocardiopsis coralli]